MLTRRQWLLSTPALAGVTAFHAEAAEQRLIKAGPFSIQCPAEWAEGIVVEKVPCKPLFTHEQWLAFKANPANNLKAGYHNRPEHWAIRFPRLATSDTIPKADYGYSPTAPQILIHETSGWAGIFETGSPTEAGRRAKTIELRKEIDAAMEGRLDFHSPLISDGAVDFCACRRVLSFNEGRGVRMLGQWCFEATLLTDPGLHYLFEGMSADDSCYVVATFPLKLKGLTSGNDDDASHLGYSLKDYPRLEKEFENYSSLAVKWLEERQEQIQPKLADLDAMMESLRAVTWE
jgi:hypothetical protein